MKAISTMQTGVLISIEGDNRTLVAEQQSLLEERLKSDGYEVEIVAFPRTGLPSNYFVNKYLGDHNDDHQVNPYAASLFYALDYYDAAIAIRRALAGGKVVLTSQYTGAVMAEQGSYFTESAKFHGFLVWLDYFVYEILQVPRPALNIFLCDSSLTDSAAGNTATCDKIRQLYPKEFDCLDYGQLDESAGTDELNRRLLEKVSQQLPEPPGVVELGAVPTDGRTTMSFSYLTGLRLFRYGIKALAGPVASEDADNVGRYYIPAAFDAVTAAEYTRAMDNLLATYDAAQKQLFEYLKDRASEEPPITRQQVEFATAGLLPVAASQRWQLNTTPSALKQTAEQHHINEITEASGATTAATPASRSGFLNQFLTEMHMPIGDRALQLTAVRPRNELDIVSDILYEHSNLSLQTIQSQVDAMPYERKLQIFDNYVNQLATPHGLGGGVFESVTYDWEIVSDIETLCKFMQSHNFTDITWQELTPRYGYDIPDLIEEAGLTDAYEESFEISLKLHSILQQAGYKHDAQYATLLGHKLRWKVTYNARQAFELNDFAAASQNHPGYREMVQGMHDKVAEVHPLIASTIRQL